MTIREWFYELFHFPSMIRTAVKMINDQKKQIAELEKAIRVRDYALESLGTPDVVSEEENKPLRTFRPHRTYTEIQRQYETLNHRSVRDALAAAQRQRERQQAK